MQAKADAMPLETEISYIGGEITRGDADGYTVIPKSLEERIKVAYVLPEDGDLTVGKESVWNAVVEGGTEPYYYQYALYHKSFEDTGSIYTYVDGSVCETNESTYTFTVQQEGWYLMQFRVTDATGEYVVFQSSRFATSTDEIRLLVEEIVEVVIKPGMSDYEKALVLHDCLCDSAEYDSSLTIHEPVGVLLQKTGVCESFALAYQMLLSEAGVEAIYVEGFGGNEYHAWNMIHLDGEWYHVDVTWDEARSDRYFFGMSDELISRSHTVTSRVPAATGTKYNHALNGSDGAFSTLDELLALFLQLPEDQEYYNFYYTGNKLIADSFYAWCQSNGDLINLATYGCADGEQHTLYVFGSCRVTKTDAQQSPVVPENLSAAATGANAVLLSWTGNETATAYEVYASVNNAGYQLLASVTEEEYAASGLQDGTWRFKVRAVYGSEVSVFTKAVYKTFGQKIQLAFPTGLTAEVIGEYCFHLTWEAVENATGYRVYISEAGGDYTLYGETEWNYFYADGLTAGSAYRVKVSAIYDVDGQIIESEYSEECGVLLEELTASDESLFTIRRSDGVITAYTGNETHIVVPEMINGITVRGIHITVFWYNTSIEEVVLPDTITDCGSFVGCTALRYIKLPAELKTLPSSAFANCTSLKYIKLPAELTSVGGSVFRGCTSLETVIFNDKLTAMQGQCFEGCTALREIDLPSSITTLELDRMFYECTSLERVTLPENANCTNAERTFQYCTALRTVKLPETITTLGSGFLLQCKELTEVIVPSKVTHLGNSVFGGCASLETVVLPEGLEVIGPAAFSGCVSLENIVIPSTVTSIGYSAFYRAGLIRYIELPQGLIELGECAFQRCTALEQITIPSGVEELGTYTFDLCESLKTVNLSEGLLTIGDHCFDGCLSLREITIPSTVQSIGSQVFEYDAAVMGQLMIKGLTKIYLKCANVRFPADMVKEYFADAPVIFIVPAGSRAHGLCEQYGYLCAAPGEELHMLADYSTDASNPTYASARIPSLNLDNEEGYVLDTVALIADGRAYPFPFDNKTFRPYACIGVRETEGNTIAFQVANDTYAELLFMYRDAKGVRRIASNSWYFLFGSSELRIPEILSSKLTETHDGYAQVSGFNFNVEWVSTEGATYEVRLIEYGEWIPQEGGSVGIGRAVWTAQTENSCCVVPREYLVSQNLYMIRIMATEPLTGNTAVWDSDMFVVYDADDEAFRLTAPFDSEMISASEQAPYYIADTGGLSLAWSDKAWAQEYRVRLDACLNGSFYAFGQEYVTEDTTLTIPSEDIYRSDNVHHYRLTLTALAASGSGEYIQTHFTLGQDQPLTLSLNGTALPQKQWNAPDLPTGTYELSWTALPGMDTYTLEICKQADGKWQCVRTLDVRDALCITSVWDEEGAYSIKVIAAAGDEKVSAGGFYLNVYLSEDDAPDYSKYKLTLVSPGDDWMYQGELNIEWTESLSGIYKLTFGRYQLSDSGTGYYYEWYKKENLTETTHTIPAQHIEYNTSYVVRVESGTESVEQYFKVLGPTQDMPVIEGITYTTDEQSLPVNRSCEEIVISWPDTDEIAFFETVIRDDHGSILYSERVAADPVILPGNLLSEDGSYELIMRAFGADNFSREYRAWFIMSRGMPSLSLDRSEIALFPCVGYVQTQLTALLSNEEDSNVIWTSSNNMVASVENGVVYAVGAGDCIITAALSGQEDTVARCNVTVYESTTCVCLPKSTTTIEAEAFAGSGIECVIIPEGTITIGSRSFAQCSRLFVVLIPDSVTGIAPDAFVDTPQLTILCTEGSAAHQHAMDAGIPVEFIK